MDRTGQSSARMRRERRLTQILLVVAALVLFCGLFAQIAVRSQVTKQAKQIAQIQTKIDLMETDVGNTFRCINQHRNPDDIKKRALELGMIEQAEGQLRVVNLPAAGGNTSTQTVANIDGEEING